MIETLLGILNGTVGDYLASTGNSLATPMAFVGDAPTQGSRLVILAHGLMNTEACFRFADGSDYGDMLARDFGYVPLRLRYNSGAAIADNGEALARLIHTTLEQRDPASEILFVGFSMGGLVIRSACHVAAEAGMPWLSLVRRCIYIGTPHLGAPAERAGRVLNKLLKDSRDPYVRLVGQVAALRSAGLQDLGDADLRHDDRALRRPTFGIRDSRHPVPLLPQMSHYFVAGSVSNHPWIARVFGDSVVPVGSASDGAITWDGVPPSHIRVVRVAHMTLCRDAAVYAAMKDWCAP